MPFIETILIGAATGVSANKVYDAAKKYCRAVLGYEDNELISSLYACFDRAFERYCKEADYHKGGCANSYLLREENWEIIVDILNFKTVEINFEKFNKNSICGQYQADHDMVLEFIKMLEVEIAKDLTLSNKIQEKKFAWLFKNQLEGGFKEVSLKLDELLQRGQAIKCLDHFPSRVSIHPDDLEMNVEAILDDEAYVNWLGQELFSATRKVILELAINARRHGCATDISVCVNRSSIVIRDNGKEFNSKKTFVEGRNTYSENGLGKDMFEEYLNQYPNTVSISCHYAGECNITTIDFTNAESQLIERCSVTFSNNVSRYGEPAYPVDCDTYFFLITRMMATSAANAQIRRVMETLPKDKTLVVRVEDSMERKVLKRRYLGHPKVIIE